jgi:hypothetical protein
MPRQPHLPWILLVCAVLGLAPAARAQDEGRTPPSFSLHGFGELQLRTYSKNFDEDYWVPGQWAHVLNLEFEADLVPDGIGPFDLISAFARVEVRYDCIYSGCGGAAPTGRWWGGNPRRGPRNHTTGYTTTYTGVLEVVEPRRIHRDNHLADYGGAISALDDLIRLGSVGVGPTFAPIDDAQFVVKDIDASQGRAVFPMGPWDLQSKIDEVGSLASVPNQTSVLPLRPQVGPPGVGGLVPQGLFIPSDGFLRLQPEFDDHEQQLSERDLSWNHGQGQDERELKEAYLDVEMFDGRLWIRAGKQSIVWGKTELFRTTDQFNPQDLALSSLPSLEESRLSLWSVRGVWSFYDVGPLEDVRLEVAFNYDDFEPLDLGRCGEPYTVWLVCGKTFGLWAHGFAGAGIAGEIRPPDPWDKSSWHEGLEFGARVEWRWDRFSFQLSDFYGYEDAPVIDYFSAYERKVDPVTGRPLGVDGRPLRPEDTDEDILRRHTGNRQLFDMVCSATEGIAGAALPIPGLEDECLLDLLNSPDPIAFGLDPAAALGTVFGGSFFGAQIAGIIAGGGTPPFPVVELIELNKDLNDGPGFPGVSEPFSVSSYLTDQQEALLGCGPFFDTNCDGDGIDLFNAEASVLVQSFPQFEPNGPVATRPVGGLPVVIAGARGPLDDIDRDGVPDLADPSIPDRFKWSAGVDGCVSAADPGCAGADDLVHPITGELFRNEMAALSYNFLILLASLGESSADDPDCSLAPAGTPYAQWRKGILKCDLVRGVMGVAGSSRPEVRAGGNGQFGRRDFIWHGGSELAIRYEKRNVLGFAFDFAEDRTKSNWSIEATWFHDQPYSVVDNLRGFDENDTFNLTVSVDRPTFINFLNPGRTFFMNSQWFLRYIDDYRQGGYVATGPVSVLGTFTVVTGYHQDRLLPSLTWVHDVRSTSGGVIGQLTYRFTTEFAATIGIAGFYGSPEPLPVALRQPLPQNLGGEYRAFSRYNGLSPLAERDEVYMLLRYTF